MDNIALKLATIIINMTANKYFDDIKDQKEYKLKEEDREAFCFGFTAGVVDTTKRINHKKESTEEKHPWPEEENV